MVRSKEMPGVATALVAGLKSRVVLRKKEMVEDLSLRKEELCFLLMFFLICPLSGSLCVFLMFPSLWAFL